MGFPKFLLIDSRRRDVQNADLLAGWIHFLFATTKCSVSEKKKNILVAEVLDIVASTENDLNDINAYPPVSGLLENAPCLVDFPIV
jgi:hypothetical protein